MRIFVIIKYILVYSNLMCITGPLYFYSYLFQFMRLYILLTPFIYFSLCIYMYISLTLFIYFSLYIYVTDFSQFTF